MTWRSSTVEWRAVDGFDGRYLVSSDGRVRDALLDVELKQRFAGPNYLLVVVGGVRQYVHRLVATAYLPNPEGKPQVNHKDCDKTNNCVRNLEWVTRAENMAHAKRAGVMQAASNPNCVRKLTPDDVMAIRVKHSAGVSQLELGRQFNVSGVMVGMIVRGARRAKG